MQRLVFTVTGEQAGPGNTQFTLTGADGGYATYSTAAAELSGETALILAELYLKDEWRLAAVGQGFQGGLEALLEHFGGQSASPPQSQPQPSSQQPPQPTSQPRTAVWATATHTATTRADLKAKYATRYFVVGQRGLWIIRSRGVGFGDARGREPSEEQWRDHE